MVTIVIGAIPPVLNNQNKQENPTRSPQKKKSPKEKRKRAVDRRKEVRSGGGVVTLSKYPDRRKGGDRRKK